MFIVFTIFVDKAYYLHFHNISIKTQYAKQTFKPNLALHIGTLVCRDHLWICIPYSDGLTMFKRLVCRSFQEGKGIFQIICKIIL